MNIRPASPDEGWLLRDIEIASKAYWGYPDELMKRFAKVISMAPDYIWKHEVWVIEDAAEIAGFYGLIHRGEVCELDHLWLLPRYIGKGLGRQLFEHALQRARVAGALRMEWQAEPNATGFYKRMGGRYVRTETGLLGTPIEVMGLELGPGSAPTSHVMTSPNPPQFHAHAAPHVAGLPLFGHPRQGEDERQ